MVISPTNLKFLKELKRNNNREWFNQNKEWYQKEYQNIIEFVDSLIVEMNKHDVIETPSGKRSLFRIYRDIRFSKDKTPYKVCWSGSLRRATSYRRGGYYYHIEPGNSFVAGGFWGPNSGDITLIRKHIAQDDSQLRDILNEKKFIHIFKKLKGEKVKTAPKGYSKDHPSIDLLKFKQFLLYHSLSDKEVTGKNFVKIISQIFIALHPFFNYMSEILTTDLNGISLIKE